MVLGTTYIIVSDLKKSVEFYRELLKNRSVQTVTDGYSSVIL